MQWLESNDSEMYFFLDVFDHLAQWLNNYWKNFVNFSLFYFIQKLCLNPSTFLAYTLLYRLVKEQSMCCKTPLPFPLVWSHLRAFLSCCGMHASPERCHYIQEDVEWNLFSMKIWNWFSLMNEIFTMLIKIVILKCFSFATAKSIYPKL